ncbi:MAG: imidazoleglycerol-phosphate dehydratase HisB [Atopobiaceae bacterium]|nr:imidazoleglycerol-phosphate dehydratase HisB [Atopobiaceae bacterium]
MRKVSVSRKTSETDIQITLDLDGSGKVDVETGVGFFDHMLNAFGRHGLFDLYVRVKGDTWIDTHHTVEDTGIVLGQAFAEALGDKAGITRFADVALAMDEALILGAVDISGRGALYWDVDFVTPRLGEMDTEVIREFFIGLARDGRFTLHLKELAGENDHHVCEACFKAAGRALRFACELDPRVQGIPSTKGSL